MKGKVRSYLAMRLKNQQRGRHLRCVLQKAAMALLQPRGCSRKVLLAIWSLWLWKRSGELGVFLPPLWLVGRGCAGSAVGHSEPGEGQQWWGAAPAGPSTPRYTHPAPGRQELTPLRLASNKTQLTLCEQCVPQDVTVCTKGYL